MLVGMIVEGPWVTAAASFGAALGHFNPWVVFLLSISGDLVPDTVYYWIGRYFRHGIHRNAERYLKISRPRLEALEGFVRDHQVKALALFKYTPFLAFTGLVLNGAIRTPFRRFIAVDFLTGLPNTLFFMFIGYNFGLAAERFKGVAFWLPVGIIVFILIYVAYRYVIRLIRERLAKDAGLDKIDH